MIQIKTLPTLGALTFLSKSKCLMKLCKMQKLREVLSQSEGSKIQMNMAKVGFTNQQ